MDELIDVIEGTQDDTAWAELVHPDTTDVAPAPAKRPVERHGGRPAAPASPQAGHAPRATAGPGIRRVLVVDDNADAAQTVAMLLEVLGHEAAVEYDPLQALVCAREGAFDAFVLDIGLPGMDGHELARQIRTLPQAAGALFIALTGYGQQQDRDASAAAGFHYHFVKPADVDALARALAGGVPE
ncbi:response regulator [Massilia pinisoli]|uniref:Response regulator n=1 Tax=Massilia pinisoli TaxID=1772194 RepID=A0ABT1ZTH5_9BURK|nr:response regulator [Massilia pinisoli]MCS0583220.1 response regulator [Massilia pinisoli]